MAEELDNKEVAEAAVQASNENAAYIINAIKDTRSDLIERVQASDARTRETFDAHEKRDQERFDETTQALVAHREQIGGQLTTLTREVRETNGGLKEVQTKVSLVEDRASQAADRASKRLNWIAILASVAGGSAFAAACLGIVKLLGG